MTIGLHEKSTPKEIEERFDNDVDRFSNLETGQLSTIDAPLCLELMTAAAQHATPKAKHLLDIGCGAGNFTLKMLSRIPDLNCTLLDLSGPMLERAQQRVQQETTGEITLLQADIREANLPENHFDIILAGAVLHHLREEKEWEFVFRKLFNLLKPGGSLWISDLVVHDDPGIHQLFWNRYAEYLISVGGEIYKDQVLAYIEKEDSPRSVTFQLELLRKVGFKHTEILHKNACFAAFGAIK
ncbi:class I SAM-dependent methyltransferase [Rufibacter hautae]|uniref:Class I SAM-dependent methyltransferase n=1 Tax=Rufibacter hautae TaxID=2595005 RepID=A0A5B6TGS2_9BACT|nr:class I SAM-dependent methyltransferase [Rufibacter hautae]KAA3438515.1 class I SAM-dependent methyltransferase [Rufibacter hautae]